MTQHGLALHYTAGDLKVNSDVVLAAVTQLGRVLGYAAEDLKADRDVVLVAIRIVIIIDEMLNSLLFSTNFILLFPLADLYISIYKNY